MKIHQTVTADELQVDDEVELSPGRTITLKELIHAEPGAFVRWHGIYRDEMSTAEKEVERTWEYLVPVVVLREEKTS